MTEPKRLTAKISGLEIFNAVASQARCGFRQRRLVPWIAMLAAAVIALALLGETLVLAQDQQSGAAPPESPAVNASSPSQASQEIAPGAEPAPAPHPRTASRSSRNRGLSSNLSDYLHHHHLPFVDALVFSNEAGQATSVKLSGEVRTEHGKEDAAIKARDFLNQPGLRVQNDVEVNASLESSSPPSASAATESALPESSSAAAAAPSAQTGPCADMCMKDEGHCDTACQSQAAGGATSGGFSVQALLGQVGQSATQLNECRDQCVQVRQHCVYQCGQGGGEAQSEGTAPPPDSGAAPADNSGPPGGGPDTPPE